METVSYAEDPEQDCEESPRCLTSDTVVSWNDDLVFVSSDGISSKSSLHPTGLTAGALRHLISTRVEVGKKTPTGWALKIGTNSVYGALGAKTSKLQSYRAASMITAMGRFITVLAVRIKMLRRKWREGESMNSQWCIQKDHGE